MLNGFCWDAGFAKAQLLERLHNVTDLWFDSPGGGGGSQD